MSLQQILNEGGLMIVESPTKAREITKFLPSNGKWKVVPTVGFMFELMPTKQIPESKKDHYGRYSVRVDDLSFDRLLTHDPQNRKNYTEIKKLVDSGKYKHFYVSTDPDEAGELIGEEVVDHLAPNLRKSGMDVRRASWHEITKKAVEEGLSNWGDIDRAKADSAEARQIYDRLFGFSVSQYLWKTNAGKSGGRAQSPCLRLIVDREKERMAFIKANYSSIHANFTVDGEQVEATLTKWDGQPIATGSDFDPQGNLKSNKKLILNEDNIDGIRNELNSMGFIVADVKEKPYTRNPPAPFTTSSFQQSVGTKLGLSSKRAMQLAQFGFEHADITYLRTDSPMMAPEAVEVVRQIIQRDYKGMMPTKPRVYKPKSKNAQEGHECIRPVVDEDSGMMLTPSEVKRKHSHDSNMDVKYPVMYDLIYRRTIASQMDAATGVTKTIIIKSTDGKAEFSASSTRIDYPGFLSVYED